MSENEDFDDAKMGSHSVDTTPVKLSGGDEDHIPFEIETEAVFKRLARDIYESDSAGIREPLTNAVTAILRAVNYGAISEKEGVVTIKVEEDGNGTRLTMRDNGIGMSRQKIEKIVSVIGASESRDIGELAGQFGMGFLAVFRLVGIDGGFEMYTNPRYKDEDPIGGIWKSGGFTIDDDGMLMDGLNEDEYGTKFSFIVKDDISRTDIRNWVSKYSEWARVPVVYEEFVNGSQQFDENYGGFEKKLESTYEDGKPFVKYEDEYVSAVSSPASDTRTILLDVPCERRSGQVSTILGSIDVRLKNENGVIVDGPNEGQMKVSNGEYDNMEEERRDEFIPHRDVSGKDVVMPQPTGTRRVLERENQFWSWVKNNLQEQLEARLNDILSDVDTLPDLMSLEQEEYRMVLHAAKNQVQNRYRSGYNPDKHSDSIKSWFKRNCEVSITEELAKQMGALVYRIRFADRDNSRNISKKRSLEKKTPALAHYKSYQNDGQIFMGCRLSEDKANVAWEDSDYNYVFSVESTDEYEVYEDLLGWEKLKSINKKTIDEFDVSDETKEELLGDSYENSNNSSSTEYNLKFHFKSGRNYTKDVTVDKIEGKLEEKNAGEPINIGHRETDSIVLFPTHKDKNISEYYWVSDSRNPVARCRKKDWNRLSHYDCVLTVDSLIERSRQVEFSTSDGKHTIASFEDKYDKKDIMFHVLEEPYRSRFDSEEFMRRSQEYVNTNCYSKSTDFVYAPVTVETLRKLHPSIQEHNVLLGDEHTSTLANTSTLRTDTRLYAWVRLYEWTDTKEYDIIQDDISRTELGSGGYELVETLRQGMMNDEPFSQNGSVREQIGK
jgi:hypothetical protein